MLRRADRISPEAQTRKSSSIKAAAKHLSKPGIISLGGGLPSSDYFPFSSVSWKVPRIGHFSESDTDATGETITSTKHDMAAGNSLFDPAIAFNYGQGTGAPQLMRFVTEHTEIVLMELA